MSRHILFCLGLILAIPTAQAADSAKADLRTADGKAIGSATLADTPKGVLITLDLKGAPEGVHAFHVHEVGKCEPPFKSAGAHFNPDHKKHGFVAEGPHAGDMPNLHIPASGDLEQEVLNPNLSLAAMLDADGAAVILHAKADDYKSDPAGNAGDRVACGVVEKASP
jgi:Cu-Zn family superoxide dismutase